MPCSDSSSSIALKLDAEERFISFEFAKITCGREITAETQYSRHCAGKTLQEIFETTFLQAAKELNLGDEESQFILFLEWDALRCAIAQYLGVEDENIDRERCQIASVDHNEKGVQIAMIILPPKDIPKILPCNINNSD